MNRLKAAIPLPALAAQAAGLPAPADGCILGSPFRHGQRSNKISACPKVLTREIARPPLDFSGNMDRAYSLYELYHLSNCIFGRNSNIHVNMVFAQMPFQNAALTLPSQDVKHFAQASTNFTEKYFSTTLRYPHDVILAVPRRMA